MTKATFTIKTRKGFDSVEGYITNDGLHGIDKRGKAWYITDLASGIALNGVGFPKRKDAEASIAELEQAISNKKVRETSNYIKACEELNKHLGKEIAEVKADKEGKKMAKTNTKAKASKKATAKADTNKGLEAEIERLKAEIERLKGVITDYEKALVPEIKGTIDDFDVEGYMSSRDDSARITPELVQALENTEGLVITRKGKDEWLYVSGKTEADTKERKDIFKAMGFRWSANENAWFIAPYPLRSKKAWGAKKARKAMATA